MQNRGNTKHVVGHVKVPVRLHILRLQAAALGAVHGDIGLLRGDAQARKVAAGNTSKATRRNIPGHGVVAEVGQRVAQRGQLPVQHRQNARLGGVKNQVVQAVVVFRHGWDVVRQPGDELVHFGDRLGNGGQILLAPSTDLAFKIIARFAVSGQTLRCDIDLVQGGNDAVHLGINGAALCRCHARQRLVPQNAPFDKFHHVKGASNDRLVLAQAVHMRHGYRRAGQAAHHGELALDGVRRRQQLGHRARFGTHHIAALGRDELVGWVALAAFEGFDAQRPAKSGQMLLQPGGQGVGVKGVFGRYRLRADEMVKVAHGEISWVGGGRLADVGLGYTHDGRAVAHHQAARLDADDAVTLHGLELLVHPLARGAQQLRQLFLRQLQADARFAAVAQRRNAIAAHQVQQLLGQARAAIRSPSR